jgi:hypothetical protein
MLADYLLPFILAIELSLTTGTATASWPSFQVLLNTFIPILLSYKTSCGHSITSRNIFSNLQ